MKRMTALERGERARALLDPENCPVCAYLVAHGWNGPGIAHCRHCHAVWSTGTKVAHCTKCHRTFSTDGACERAHSAYTDDRGELLRRCHDPAGIVNRRSGERVFADPEPNGWGTAVWSYAASGRHERGGGARSGSDG